MPEDTNSNDEIVSRFRQSWRADESCTLERFVETLDFRASRELAERLILLDIKLRLDNDKPVERSLYSSLLHGDMNFDRILRTADVDATQDLSALESLDCERTSVFTPSNAETNAGSYSGVRTRYSKLREHAAGGLGKVFVAADHELQRQVALKTIQQRYSKDSASQKRFVLEAQVTGALEHPGIVPVYSLNVDDDGTPYYTMRFVEGRSLKEEIAEFHAKWQSGQLNGKIDYQGKGFRSLIRRFVDVCNAIHFAHSKGILHRDIKPDNIMLGSFGESLVVDWGLAKVLGGREERTENETTARVVDSSTLAGARLGTPVYMSPEQALGFNDRLTPATDIYSLGATLFTLITSGLAVQGDSSQEVIDAVAGGRIRAARELHKTVPWALDAICSKAMAREPDERYATARELADDLESWTADEAISEQTTAEPMAEKAGRLVRRYRTWTIPVLAAATTVLFVSVAASLLINQSRRNEAVAKTQAMLHKTDALDRYRQSQHAINKWLVSTSRDLEYFPATTSLREQLLESAVQEFEQLASSPSDDPDLELERIRAKVSLGDLLQAQTATSRAKDAYTDASEWANVIAETSPGRQEIRAEILRIQGKIATVSLAEGVGDTEAINKLAEAVKGLNALCQSKDRLDLTLEYLANLAAVYARSLFDASQYQRVVDEVGKYESTVGLVRDRELALARLAIPQISSLTKLGGYERAAQKLLQIQDTMKTAVLASPDSPPHLEELAFLRVLQADLFRVSGREEQCIVPLEMAAEDYQTLTEALPDIPRYKESLGATYVDIGLSYLGLHEYSKAKAALLEGKALFEGIIQYYPLFLEFQDGYAVCLDGLAQCEEKLGTFDQAELYASAAAQINADLAAQFESRRLMYMERTAIAWSHRASVLSQQGDFVQARQLYVEAEELLIQLYEAMQISDYAHALGHVTYQIAELDNEQGEATSAQAYFEEAYQYWRGLQQNSPTNRSRYQLAWFYVNCPLVEFKQADKAIAILKLQSTPELKSRSLLAEALAIAGQFDDAESVLDELTSRRGFLAGEDLVTRANIQLKRNEPELAIKTLGEARDWHLKNGPGAVRVARKLEEIDRQLNAQTGER